jgi:ribose 5-phosphate isomerase B
MVIGIASDHAGFILKEKVKQFLTEKGYEYQDFGTMSETSTDYPDHIHPLSKAVNEGILSKGIAICGSGEGVCMTANKYPQVRAALVWEVELAKLSRQHNNANIICLPARFISESLAFEAIEAFLTTDFEGGRHETRVDKISKIQ